VAYDSRVYRILIASPSDVEEEREIAVRVIQEWNDLYSFSRKVTLLPLRWETHTAPEYGTRPQEVINRTIVDQCDLLVGVFWTRLGSPTGEADSGTLEEIARVGDAGKPVMLYFSKAGIDPDLLDLSQVEKLKDFKTKTYPKGLIENYKSVIEFRDKFSKQLELRVRDLQKNEGSTKTPLSFEFLSLDTNELLGKKAKMVVEKQVVKDLTAVPTDKKKEIKLLLDKKVKQQSIVPINLAIDNSGSSGIRNLYIELNLESSSKDATLTDSTTKGFLGSAWTNLFISYEHKSKSKLAKLDSDILTKTDKGWQISFDWDAIQPQRTRAIKTNLYYSSPKTSTLSAVAKIFADSFPEPLIVEIEMKVEIKEKVVDLAEFIPDWEERLLANEENPET